MPAPDSECQKEPRAITSCPSTETGLLQPRTHLPTHGHGLEQRRAVWQPLQAHQMPFTVPDSPRSPVTLVVSPCCCKDTAPSLAVAKGADAGRQDRRAW